MYESDQSQILNLKCWISKGKVMFQKYPFMLLKCLSIFSIQIKANLYEESFHQWEKSQVIIYTAKSASIHKLLFTSKSVSIRGKCFGNLISAKHVLTIASCILEEKDRMVNDKKVKFLIEETRIHRVSKYLQIADSG